MREKLQKIWSSKKDENYLHGVRHFQRCEPKAVEFWKQHQFHLKCTDHHNLDTYQAQNPQLPFPFLEM